MEILVDGPDIALPLSRQQSVTRQGSHHRCHCHYIRYQEDILVRSTTLDGEMRCQITASGCGTRICSIVRFVHISWVR